MRCALQSAALARRYRAANSCDNFMLMCSVISMKAAGYALQDLRLVAALEQLPQLNALVLAGCADITDRCLAVSPPPPSPFPPCTHTRARKCTDAL